jgi:hypothetical protein
MQLLRCLLRLALALSVLGVALPTSTPSSRGVDLVEKAHKSARVTSTPEVASVRLKRELARSRHSQNQTPRSIMPTRAAPAAPTWMRPRRTPPSDDGEDDALS